MTSTEILGLEKSHWVTIFTALLAAIVLIAGWYRTSRLTSDRDFVNKQRELKISYLMDAYDKLALSANRPKLEGDYARMLEAATAKIQLFGSQYEIQLLHKFLDEWAASEKEDHAPKGNLDDLLFALRNSLRKDLFLQAVDSKIRWIRPEGGPPQ